MTPEAACLILGVSASAGADEIRSAYRRIILKHHPDRAEPSEREEATRLASEVNAAYELLMSRLGSDPTPPFAEQSRAETAASHSATHQSEPRPQAGRPDGDAVSDSGPARESTASPFPPGGKTYSMDCPWPASLVFSAADRSVRALGWRIYQYEPSHGFFSCRTGMSMKNWVGQGMIICVTEQGGNESRVQVNARPANGMYSWGEGRALTTKLFERIRGLLQSDRLA